LRNEPLRSFPPVTIADALLKPDIALRTPSEQQNCSTANPPTFLALLCTDGVRRKILARGEQQQL
jgi:hypothetical protein